MDICSLLKRRSCESTAASPTHWLRGPSAEQLLAHTGALHLSFLTVPPCSIRPPTSPLP